MLADCIRHQIVDALGTADRGSKGAKPGVNGLYVLSNTGATAVLVELAFIDNEDDAQLLCEKQDEFARAIARGVTDYEQEVFLMVDWKMLQSEMKVHAVDFVRKEAKEAAVLWLKNVGLPAAKEIASAYIAALKESAEKETGWCRFRDCVFLPGVVQGALWLAGNMLDRMTAESIRHEEETDARQSL